MTSMAPDDCYDLVFVTMQAGQLPDVLPILKQNRSEYFVFVGNDPHAVEVMQAIAAKLGVTATFAETEWDGIFAGLDSGRYDIAANGVEVTDERAQKYDFSTPYGYIRTALIVRGDNTDIQSFEDLKGKHTANSIASTYMTLAEGYGATAAGVDTLDQTIQMVLSGRADATLNAEVSFYDYMNVHPDGRSLQGVPAHAQGRTQRFSAGSGQ